MSAVAPAPPSTATGHRPASFRPDVEGLRAIAVLSVLAYHAGLPLITGGYAGVDIFFVLSGFLITGQLLKEVGNTGTVDLPAFYGRRFKRLLPAATLVLAFTAIGTWLFLPLTRFKDVAWDIGLAAVYLINWRLADQSVDYLAEDTEPSPVQHYWSLAVEEQFYVVWPLVLLVVGLVVTRARTPLLPTATLGLLAIAIPSLVWSVVQTQNSPETAYFVTTTRLWELAIGGLVACGATVWPRLSPRIGTLLVVLGLAVIGVSFFTITAATPWPGTAALLPTLGTAAALVGGASGRGPVLRALGSAPMLWVGALSYSLYLWHWPLVVLTEQGIFAGRTAPLWATVAAALASFPLAWAGNRFIENPVRFAAPFKRTRNALSLGAGLSVLGALGAVALVTLSPGTPSSPTADPKQTDERVGAEALLPEGMDPQDVKATTTPVVTEAAIPDAPKSITPAVTDATKDYPVTKDEGCVTSVDGTDVKSCTFGDEDSDKVLVAAGDSKIDQWIPAIDDWGQANGYQVVTYFKSACPFNGELLATDDPRWQGCHDWGQQVNQEITALDPDILLTSSLMAGAGDNGEAKVVTGYEKVWTPLLERGTKVVVVDDTTSPGGTPVYECVAEHLDSVNECTFPDKGGRGSATLKKAVDAVDGAQFMSLNDFVCPEGTCRPVVGGVLTYRQGSHISDTYARTLSPMFGARLDAALAAAQ